MSTLLTIVHVFACVFLILTVLLQAGKGGGVGVALGGQTSAQVFGGRGAGSFLERLTSGTAIVFMITSMSLAYLASQSDSARLQRLGQEQAAKKKAAEQKAADDKAAKDAEDRAKEEGQKPEGATEAAPAAAPAGDENAPAQKAAEPAKPEPAPSKSDKPGKLDKADDAAKKAAPPTRPE